MTELDKVVRGLKESISVIKLAKANYDKLLLNKTKKKARDRWFLDAFVGLTYAHKDVDDWLRNLEQNIKDLQSYLMASRRPRGIRVRTRRGKISKLVHIHLASIKELLNRYQYVRRECFNLIPFVIHCDERAIRIDRSWETEELTDYLRELRVRWKNRQRRGVAGYRQRRAATRQSESQSGSEYGDQDEGDESFAVPST